MPGSGKPGSILAAVPHSWKKLVTSPPIRGTMPFGKTRGRQMTLANDDLDLDAMASALNASGRSSIKRVASV
jgi:hypothetical protein